MKPDQYSGMIVALAGLAVILAAFLVAVFHYGDATDVATSLAAITGTVGTVIGAYFGVQAGSSAGNKAAQHAESARQDAEAARKNLEDHLGAANATLASALRPLVDQATFTPPPPPPSPPPADPLG